MATIYSNVLLRFDGKATFARGTTPVRVRGSNGADTVTIERGVEAVLDGSFNRGNDVINFAGLASTYTISAPNSSSILVTDALGTSVTIPVGVNGATINFADASRVLVGGASGITLGTQVVSATAAAVSAGSGVVAPFAPNDEVGVIPGANPAQVNTVVLVQGAQVNLGEGTDPTVIRGTNGIDVVEVAAGNVLVLDGSFNRGNDTIKFEGLAEDYRIVRNGSSAVVITDDAGTSVTIPVGVNGTAIEFADVTRELVGGANGLFLGEQQVGSVPAAIADGGTGLDANFHTLTANLTEGSEGTPPEFAVFWGYNPNRDEDDNSTEGPLDGGIPLSALEDFLTLITGLDLTELGLIDDDGMGPFDNVTNLEISNATSLTGASTGGTESGSGSVLEISFADGTQQQFNIEAQIGEQYFEFLNNLLFDSEGNSRLFLKEVPGTGSSGTAPEIIPVVLTPAENNGGTIELDRTSSADDTIVAGRLELLHRAYIDGGAGRNVLEIDAKGLFAQPLELLNIQEIRVTDLPNFYTGDDGDGEQGSNTYPDVSNTGSDNSIIDLTRAVSVELLVVSDQGTVSGDTASGDLTIVGVRNGATLRLEGGFNSGATTIQYADVDPAGLTVELNVGTVNESINILQNSAVLNVVSQGTSNFIQNFFGGGELTTLNISGTGRFGAGGDLDSSFVDNTPVTINAATNSGGVDVELSGSQNVTIIGSLGNDRFTVETSDVDGGPENDETVSITGGVGNNYYEIVGADIVTITNANGANNYEIRPDGGAAVGSVTITTGDGNNVFELANVATVDLSAGNGSNRVELTSRDDEDNASPSATPDFVSNVDITFGNGNNTIYVQAETESLSPSAGVVEINVGSGLNEIAALGRVVNIGTTGTSANTIYALGEEISISSGTNVGNTIVIGGAGEDFANLINVLTGNTTSSPVSSSTPLDATVLLDINAGRNATVALGLEAGNVKLTALPGSEIVGTNLTLNVLTTADLRAATLSGVSKVVLDDDNFDIGDAPTANDAVAGGNAAVLTLTDIQFRQIGAANFSVDGAVFNTHSFIKIIITETTSLTALGVNNLPRNIDLIVELKDGVTLTMTAQQLHERIAQDGVQLANDGNTDLASGKVIITDAGTAFDPFNSNDKVSSIVDGTTYYGGSLSSAFDTGNYQIRRGGARYDRPADFAGEDIFYIDSSDGPQEGFSTISTGLEITGEDDVVISGVVELGELLGEAANPFEIDFSALEGSLDITVGNFELLSRGGGIFGNADLVSGSEVKVVIDNDADSTEGFDDAGAQSLVMEGVEKLTVVQILGTNGTATITLGDTVEDLQTLAFRGNFNDTLIVEDAAWGLVVELQGGSRAAADGPTGTANVGKIDLTFEQPGADAVVNLTRSLAGDTRPIKAFGVEIFNAASITVNTGAASAVIDSISGDISSADADDIVTKLTFNSAANVTLGTPLDADQLSAVDASGVTGNFTATAQGSAGTNGFVFNAADGTTTLTLSAFTGSSGTVLAAEDAATFNLVTTGAVVLNTSALSGVDAMTIGAGSAVTMTAAQALAVALSDINGSGTLNITALGSQAFNEGLLGGTVVLGTVTTASGAVTLDPATNLAGANVVVSGSVTMTAAQYIGLNTIVGDADTNVETLNITGVTQADIDAGFDLSAVNGLTNLKGTVTFVGDITLPATAVLDPDFSFVLAPGATLSVATQVQADGLDVTGGAGSTIRLLFPTRNVNDADNIDASGYNVSKLQFLDSLVVGQNVDNVFRGLLSTVVKEVYNNQVQLIDQTFNVSAGTVVAGNVGFDRVEPNLELRNFTLNLQGGASINGNVDLSVSSNTAGLIQTFFQTLTINSTGTAANPATGDTTNFVTGNIGALGGTPLLENQILDVVINATQDLVIGGTLSFTSTVNQDEVATLTVTGTSDVSIAELSTADDGVDGLNVVNNSTGTLTVGVNGAATGFDATDDLSFTGTGDIVLQIGGSVDLSDDVLTAVSSVVIEDGGSLTLTFTQADTIGAANFSAPSGGGQSFLNLVGLGSELFALANYDTDITVSLVTIAALPVVTLNPATNLTGISGLVVPEGTVLNLTAAQFQQLGGAGSITGVGGTTDFTVNITGLTQANVGTGLDLSDVTAETATLTLAGDVSLGGNSDLGDFDVAIGANKLTLAQIEQADGIDFTGATLEFLDPATAPFQSIDASGFNVTQIRFLNTLTDNGNRNIDDIFDGLPGSVLKVVFQNEGAVDTITQTVTIEAGATVTDSLVFNPGAPDTELEAFTLNLSGGVFLSGNLRLSTGDKFDDINGNGVQNAGEQDLLRSYLRTVTINSTGTAGNFLTGVTTNIITGNITPDSAPGIGGVDNNLLNITINASQDLEVRGNVVFNSNTSNDPDGDQFSANDILDATALMTVTGSADVTLGGIDITDNDVDRFSLVHNGTGVVSLTIDDADASEALSFTGSGDVVLTANGSAINLATDTLTAVSQIIVTNGSVLTITQAQFDAIGGPNIDLLGNNTGTLNIVNFGSGAFDATGIDPDFTVNLTLAAGNVTLTGNFTGVDSLNVVEGSTVTMTAAQFQQLQGAGTINVLDGPDSGTSITDGGINIVITGLTQADVDAGTDRFSLANVNVGPTGSVTISLGEPSVTLGTYVAGVLQSGSEAIINTANGVQADFVLTAGQTLGLANYAQANGLDIDGTGVTTVVAKFVPFLSPGPIDASGYDVSFLRALAAGFVSGSQNVEFVFDDLPSSTTLVLFEDPAQLGFLDPTFRTVVIETGITTPTGLIFNDFDADDEVRALDLTLEGGVVLNGNLEIPSRTDKTPGDVELKFQTLVINSEGTTTNRINGNISTETTLGAPNSSVNNLLDVVINAQRDLIIGDDATAPFVFTTGQIIFQAATGASTANNAEANLTIVGAGNVTLKGLDTTDAQTDVDDTVPGDIGTLNVVHNGTGLLTITGGSDAITLGANTTTLNFSGQGDILLDTAAGAGDNGVSGSGLTLLDASLLTGDLTLGVIEDVSNTAFTLLAGSGVTKATLIDTGLDSTNGTPASTDDTAGWLIDYTAAAVGSEFRLNLGGVEPVAGSKLTINMGPNGTLFIDGPAGSTLDLSDLVLDINTVRSIVLADQIELVLTAAQADGLDIIAGPDTGPAGFSGVVNIVDLGGDPVDLSGIAPAVAGFVSLEDDDVTVNVLTDLGSFGVQLNDVAGNDGSLLGQTVRFNTEAQAARDIRVGDNFFTSGVPGPGQDNDSQSSTNVVWLFTNISSPTGIDTSGYDGEIGRLWLTPTLINNEGGNVENLFTTLPFTILRVEFGSITELNVLLTSSQVDREVEFVHFTTVGDLTFSDVGSSPEEYLRTLELRMGGEVSIGDIVLDDVVGAPGFDPSVIEFEALTILSRQALHTDDILSSDGFVNDNDGVNETGEFTQPDGPNIIGNISVGGASTQVDLLEVNIDVGTPSDTLGVNNGRGQDLVIASITYDYDPEVGDVMSMSTAELNIEGDNNVTIGFIDTADAQITALAIDLTGFTGVLDPEMRMNNTQSLIIFNDGGAPEFPGDLDDSDGTAIFQSVHGNELSVVDASGFDGDLIMTLSQIDSTNDDSTPLTPANDGLVPAFTYTAGQGIQTITVGSVGAFTPQLNADQDWVFDFTGAAVGSRLIIDDSTVFQSSADVTFDDARVYISGDVDLSEVDLTVLGNTDFFVEAGNSLTLTVAQVFALGGLGVFIQGEGTLILVGEVPANSDVNSFGNIFTVGVDISAVTLAAADADGEVNLSLFGQPFDDDGNFGGVDGNLGYNVIGSALNDNIITAAGDDTVDGRGGDDDYQSFGGLDTFIASSGSDTADSVETTNFGSPAEESDIVIVEVGASIEVETNGFGWVATNQSRNDGTASIVDAFVGPNKVIDVSAAIGANGWNITGADGEVVTIVGSIRADTINGGDSDQGIGERDELTGNLGADTFVFNIDVSDPADFTVVGGGTVYDGQPTNIAIDFERIDINPGLGTDDSPNIVVSYRLNNTVNSLNVSTLGLDVTNADDVAAAIAAAFDALLDIEAEVVVGDLDDIAFTALNGVSFEILGIGGVPGFTTNVTFSQNVVAAGSDADDVNQVSYLDISLPNPQAVLGERYNITVQLRDGAVVVTDDYVADGTESEVDLRNILLADLQARLLLAGSTLTASAYTNGGTTAIQLVGVDDQGGFDVTDFTASGAFNGSGASATLTGNVSDLANADIITDFRNGGDVIDLGLAAGTGGLSGNLDFDTGQANYAAAFAAANAALGAGTIYYFSSILFDIDGDTVADEVGLLFFDANDDGEADGLILLPGVDETEFNASFIIA